MTFRDLTKLQNKFNQIKQKIDVKLTVLRNIDYTWDSEADKQLEKIIEWKVQTERIKHILMQYIKGTDLNSL